MFYINTYSIYMYYSMISKGVRLYYTHTYIRNNYIIFTDNVKKRD